MKILLRAKLKDASMTIDSLLKLGAIDLGEKNYIDEYFGSIDLIKKTGYSFLLRLRKSAKLFLTVKTAEDDIRNKNKFNYEVEINQPLVYEEMFRLIGLDKVIKVNRKRRIFTLNRFKCGKIVISVDYFEKRGSFIKIVSQNYSGDLNEFLSSIGIDQKDILDRGCIALFLKEEESEYSKYIKN